MPTISAAFEIIRHFDDLPDDAVVQTKITALVTGLSEKTVRKYYPRVPVSPGRYGQRVGDIRSRLRKGADVEARKTEGTAVECRTP